jgi:ribosomal-protein-alanine N-acetyltransferase
MAESLPDYHYQTASIRDLPALRTFEKQVFPHDAWPLLDLIGLLTFPNIVRYKASLDGRMVGFVAGEIRLVSRTGWIATLGVHPEFRRQGIGEKLLEICEQELSQPRLRLTVRASNKGAINLYRVNGYIEVDRWRKYYKGGEDGVVMEKIP